jgi:pimeloyl-ACP methyl ester carboxylesterase
VQPETKYTQLGRDRIAYQVIGQGPPDLVMTTASFGDIDVAWEDPGLALFCRTLASFSRLILLNRRGTGASDPLPPDPLPPWESYAEELAVILDEVGSQRDPGRRPYGAVLCRHQTSTHQRAHPGPHHGQVPGRRRLPYRRARRGR